MGPRYAERLILDLRSICEESDVRTPMICLLSMGSDPTAMIEDLAKKNGVGECLSVLVCRCGGSSV
jgi:dynein heavy chain, axonemal